MKKLNNIDRILESMVKEASNEAPNIQRLTLAQEEEENDSTDKIVLSVPLFIRLLEYAKEDAKDDMVLHKITENLLELHTSGLECLGMDDYEDIINDLTEEKIIDNKETRKPKYKKETELPVPEKEIVKKTVNEQQQKDLFGVEKKVPAIDKAVNRIKSFMGASRTAKDAARKLRQPHGVYRNEKTGDYHVKKYDHKGYAGHKAVIIHHIGEETDFTLSHLEESKNNKSKNFIRRTKQARKTKQKSKIKEEDQEQPEPGKTLTGKKADIIMTDPTMRDKLDSRIGVGVKSGITM